MRRTLTVLCGLAILLAAAARPAAADGLDATVSVPEARAGDTVTVRGSGWPGGQLLQLVTCGELALTGSGACDMRMALATPVGADGTFNVQLRVGDPPRPCPCVIHVAMVGTGVAGHVDVPLAIPGHATGPVPQAGATVSRLEVVSVRLDGRPRWSEWFGAEARRTLVYQVRNPGAQTLRDLPFNVRVGKGGGEPAPAPPSGELRPGETRELRAPVTIPFAAFGRYQVHADIAGLGAASVPYDAYPWGLVALNVIGVALIAFGAYRRIRYYRAGRALGPKPLPASDDPFLLPPVVRVPALGAVLVFDDAPGVRRLRRQAGAQVSAATLRELLADPDTGPHTAVVDLAALDRVLGTAEGRREKDTAVVDLTALDDVLTKAAPAARGPRWRFWRADR
ncbi:hypothetical protein KZZ52_47125 [Dactylosporangium sp. AC04546]|uniref:hypothetical protein n=1 Tax=Dactylosporangium sp. AC04546 TaxID=2862460 RepID=UPI001EDFF477|nr:hypothetical protein [Dactylosporangium sp. AC04546]WVK81488.1 hypothetical protein KZZ52_47125 [Dactylosporangium sp. AC04546]